MQSGTWRVGNDAEPRYIFNEFIKLQLVIFGQNTLKMNLDTVLCHNLWTFVTGTSQRTRHQTGDNVLSPTTTGQVL